MDFLPIEWYIFETNLQIKSKIAIVEKILRLNLMNSEKMVREREREREKEREKYFLGKKVILPDYVCYNGANATQ